MDKIKTLFESFLYLVVIWLSQITAKYLYVFIVLGLSARKDNRLYTKLTSIMDFNGLVTDFIYETRIVYIIVGWIIGLVIILFISRDMESILARQLFGNNSFINLLLSIVLGISLVLIVNGGVVALNEVFELPMFYLREQMTMGISMTYNIILIGVIIPILEEVFFRWILLSRLKKIMSYAPAIMLQSLLFAMFHQNLVQGIYVFALGMLCGFSVARTKVIFNAIIIHIVFNITNIYLYYILDFKVVIGQLILILVIGVLLMFVGMNYMQYTKVVKKSGDNRH